MMLHSHNPCDLVIGVVWLVYISFMLYTNFLFYTLNTEQQTWDCFIPLSVNGIPGNFNVIMLFLLYICIICTILKLYN